MIEVISLVDVGRPITQGQESVRTLQLQLEEQQTKRNGSEQLIGHLREELERLQSENAEEWGRRERLDAEKQVWTFLVVWTWLITFYGYGCAFSMQKFKQSFLLQELRAGKSQAAASVGRGKGPREEAERATIATGPGRGGANAGADRRRVKGAVGAASFPRATPKGNGDVHSFSFITQDSFTVCLL